MFPHRLIDIVYRDVPGQDNDASGRKGRCGMKTLSVCYEASLLPSRVLECREGRGERESDGVNVSKTTEESNREEKSRDNEMDKERVREATFLTPMSVLE